jgi:hypothetical protein
MLQRLAKLQNRLERFLSLVRLPISPLSHISNQLAICRDRCSGIKRYWISPGAIYVLSDGSGSKPDVHPSIVSRAP